MQYVDAYVFNYLGWCLPAWPPDRVCTAVYSQGHRVWGLSLSLILQLQALFPRLEIYYYIQYNVRNVISKLIIPLYKTVHMYKTSIKDFWCETKAPAPASIPALLNLCTGSIPLLSWSMRAVKQPSLPALHHVPVTSPVGSSRLLICCLELASGGLASVKPLSDKIQVLSSLSLRFSTWANGLFCLRHRHDGWQTHSNIHEHGVH